MAMIHAHISLTLVLLGALAGMAIVACAYRRRAIDERIRGDELDQALGREHALRMHERGVADRALRHAGEMMGPRGEA